MLRKTQRERSPIYVVAIRKKTVLLFLMRFSQNMTFGHFLDFVT